MKGIVDEDLRALIDVLIGSLPNGQKSTIVVWIDTAFNGGLVLPLEEIAAQDAMHLGVLRNESNLPVACIPPLLVDIVYLSSSSTVSPPWQVARPFRTSWLVLFITNCVEPSPITTCLPLSCRFVLDNVVKCRP